MPLSSPPVMVLCLLTDYNIRILRSKGCDVGHIYKIYLRFIRIFPSQPGCICFGYRHGILWRTLHMQISLFCWPFWLLSAHPLRQTNWTFPHAHTPCDVLSVFFHHRPIPIWENMHIVAGLYNLVRILSNTWLNPPCLGVRRVRLTRPV